MARSIPDLQLWASAVMSKSPWLRDPKCIDLPWRPVTLKPQLKIAVLWDNGLVTPTPPVQRALKEVVAKLQSKGTYVFVDWPSIDHAEAMELLGKFFVADGGKSVRDILEPVHEPFRPEMEPYKNAKELGVHELWKLHKRRTALCKRYLDRWNACESLDAILSPTTPYAAPKNGEFKSVSYTGVYNILDYSCTSFSTGIYGHRDHDVYPADFEPKNEDDDLTRKLHDPDSVHDVPVSLQLVGRRLEDEKILAMTERVVADLAS